MDTTGAFDVFSCLECGDDAEPPASRCPSCNGPLEATYDTDAMRSAHESLFSKERERPGLARYSPVFPLDLPAQLCLTEGQTPLVDCHTLADAWDVDQVLLKDEARNPTGGLVDREFAVAVAAARDHEADTVALPSTGNGGQAAAAYTARAGLESQTFVPSRSTFETKAMINVHDGEMTVVGGRYDDALEAFEEATAEEAWFSLAPFDTPYRREGAKTVAYELVAALDTVPDAIIHPTGHGVALRGLYCGFAELVATDTVEKFPRLFAAQPAGCAPIVSAWNDEPDTASGIDPVEHPDTICGTLEIPAPAGGEYVLEALDRSGGGAVAVSDNALLDAGLDLAQQGVPSSATAGAAIAAGEQLAEGNVIGQADTVVLINPTTTNREADLLRSRLMSRGV